mgnify:CR=1 FL=1
MKKNYKKMFIGSILLIAIFTVISSSVFAAPTTDTKQGRVGGCDTTGTLSIGSTSAIGSTSISGNTSPADLYVEVSYTYGFGTDRYTVEASKGTSGSGVGTSADSKHYGSVSISAKGYHKVVYGGTWSDNTSVRA